MTLFLLRHAPVVKEYEGCYNGWIDVDIQQDIVMPERLREQEFDAIYSSDLQRCSKTLDILGFEGYITEERLREIRFKKAFEGKSFESINPPKHALDNMQSWYDFICDEDLASFRSRIQSMLETLEGKNILICSHGGTIRMILSLLEEKDFYALFDIKIDYLELLKIIPKKPILPQHCHEKQ